jgi:hypothetical protein
MSRLAIFLALVVLFFPMVGRAEPTPESLCPGNVDPIGPPLGQVVIKNLSLDLNSDMELDIPFFDDHADVYGKLEIDVGDGLPESFEIPLIPDDDNPTWTFAYVTKPAVPGYKVHVVLSFIERDDLGDERIYVSPAPHDYLEFYFDTCALTVEGDINRDAQFPITVDGGSGDDHGDVSFKIGMHDNRALSPAGQKDVVLQAFDLIQVVPNQSRLVGGKPTVAMLTAYNNTGRWLEDVFGRVEVWQDGVLIYDRLERFGPLPNQRVRTIYIGGDDDPIVPAQQNNCRPSEIRSRGSLVLLGDSMCIENKNPDKCFDNDNDTKKCWINNNQTNDRAWTVWRTDGPRLLWMRTSDFPTYMASHAELQEIRAQGMPFIRGVYPLASVDDAASPIPYVPTSGIYQAFLDVLLPFYGIARRAALPFEMVLELHALAGVTPGGGVDRIMGVLPHDWFNDLDPVLSPWAGRTGVSMGTIAPRAVMFEAKSTDLADPTLIAPMPVLPGHELGHTYGLSLDPTIKVGLCNLNLPDLFHVAACAASGGYDEYSNPAHRFGVPTSGYWFPQDPNGVTGVEGPQCPATCMMGGSIPDAYDPIRWASGRQLIDQRDYIELFDKLAGACGSGSATAARLYVSGIISDQDEMALGWTFLNPQHRGSADFPSGPVESITPYSIAMLDSRGATLSEAHVPISWHHPEVDIPFGKLPITMFAGWADFPAGTTAFEVRNRFTNRSLAKRRISAKPPALSKPDFKVNGSGKNRHLKGSWVATDSDKGDKLAHFVLMSPDRGNHWWPVAGGLEKPKFSADITDVPAGGIYTVRVISTDGVLVSALDTTLKL